MADKRLAHLILPFLLAGCGPNAINLPEPANSAEARPLGSAFDADASGMLSGSVTWTMPGDAPPEWTLPGETPMIKRPLANFQVEEIANPNRMTLRGGKVAGAVVYLRGIDPVTSKPWQHGPVEVELTDRGIVIHQDGEIRREGFVRLGESIRIRHSGEKPHGVRGRGADFFSHMLNANVKEVKRRCDRPGRIDLTSSSGQFWASATLYVLETPYITRTDSNGRYQFCDVPPGPYEIVTEHPNWNVAARETDPETGLPVRWKYASQFEAITSVIVTRGGHMTQPLILNATTQ